MLVGGTANIHQATEQQRVVQRQPLPLRPTLNPYGALHQTQGHQGTAMGTDSRSVQKRAWRPAMSVSPASQPNSMPPRPGPARIIRRVSRPVDNHMALPSQTSLSQPASFQEYSGSQDRQYMLNASQHEDYQNITCSQPYPNMGYVEHTPVRPPSRPQPRSAGPSQPRAAISHSPAQQQGLSQPPPRANQYVIQAQNTQHQPSPASLRQAQQDHAVLHRPYNPASPQPTPQFHNQMLCSSSQPMHQPSLTQLSQDTFPDETQADPPTFAVSSSLLPASQQPSLLPQHGQSASAAASEHQTPDNAATPSSGHPANRLLMKIKGRAAAAAISNAAAATAPTAAIMQDTATSPLLLLTNSCAQQTDATVESSTIHAKAGEQMQQAVAAAVAAQQECQTLAAAAMTALNIAQQDGRQAEMQTQVGAVAKACAELSTAVASLQSASDLQSSRLSGLEASCHSMLEAVQSLAADTKSGFAALSAQQAVHFSKPVAVCLEQFTQTAAMVNQRTQAVQVELPPLGKVQAGDKAINTGEGLLQADIIAVQAPAPSQPAVRLNLHCDQAAQRLGQKRQKGSSPADQALPKKQKMVSHEFGSSTDASNSSADSLSPEPIRPLLPSQATMAPVKQNPRAKKTPAQKENLPVNKLRNQPARNAPSIYATKHAALKPKAALPKRAANAAPKATPASGQKTAGKAQSLEAQTHTYGRKRPTHAEQHPAVAKRQCQKIAPQAQQPAAEAAATQAAPTKTPKPSKGQAVDAQPALQKCTAFDALLTAMLSQDENEDVPSSPGKAVLPTPDVSAVRDKGHSPNDTACTATSCHGSAGQDVHRVCDLKNSSGKVAACANTQSRKHSRANGIQASEKQALGSGLFSRHLQDSIPEIDEEDIERQVKQRMLRHRQKNLKRMSSMMA